MRSTCTLRASCSFDRRFIRVWQRSFSRRFLSEFWSNAEGNGARMPQLSNWWRLGRSTHQVGVLLDRIELTTQDMALPLVCGAGENKITRLKAPKGGKERCTQFFPNTWRVERFDGVSYIGYDSACCLHVSSLKQKTAVKHHYLHLKSPPHTQKRLTPEVAMGSIQFWMVVHCQNKWLCTEGRRTHLICWYTFVVVIWLLNWRLKQVLKGFETKIGNWCTFIENRGDEKKTYCNFLEEEASEEAEGRIRGDRILAHHLLNRETLCLHLFSCELKTEEGDKLNQRPLALKCQDYISHWLL